MFRILGMFGLGLIFLIISPELRGSVMGEIDTMGKLLNDYSPVSYVGVAVLILAGGMFWVYRAAQPR